MPKATTAASSAALISNATKPTETSAVDACPDAELLRQARALANFAEAALYPRPGSPRGTSATALILLRESLHLALAAVYGTTCDERSLEELFATEGASREVLTSSMRDTHVSLSQIEDGLVQPGSARLACYPKATAATNARLSLTFVKKLLESLPDEDAQALRRRRWKTTRVAVALLALVALIAGVQLAAIRLIQGPDLLARVSFATSSAYDGFSAKDHTSHGRPTAILFHTVEEEQPWVEYDLGEARTIHRLEVRNRTDCCGDRASPLVLEVSLDHHDYRELAKQNENFTDWTVNFAKTEARYIRLRIPRKSMLHLERVVLR